MMEHAIIWGWLLIALAGLLVVAEFLLPTSGILVLVAFVAAAAGVFVLWAGEGRTHGLIGLLVILILGPATIAFGVRVWPHTLVGRRIIGEAPVPAPVLPDRGEVAMVGREGVVLTELRPVGTVEVDGKRYDAISEHAVIPVGARVKVTGREVAQLKVRRLA